MTTVQGWKSNILIFTICEGREGGGEEIKEGGRWKQRAGGGAYDFSPVLNLCSLCFLFYFLSLQIIVLLSLSTLTDEILGAWLGLMFLKSAWNNFFLTRWYFFNTVHCPLLTILRWLPIKYLSKRKRYFLPFSLQFIFHTLFNPSSILFSSLRLPSSSFHSVFHPLLITPSSILFFSICLEIFPFLSVFHPPLFTPSSILFI